MGELVVGGDVVGNVHENDLISNHSIMPSPKISGRLVELMPAGQYNVR